MNYSAIADNDLSLIAKIVDNIDNDKELDLSSFWPLGDNSTSFTSYVHAILSKSRYRYYR